VRVIKGVLADALQRRSYLDARRRQMHDMPVQRRLSFQHGHQLRDAGRKTLLKDRVVFEHQRVGRVGRQKSQDAGEVTQ